MFCVPKVYLLEGIPWNGKFHAGVGYAARICALNYGRNGEYWKDHGLE